MCSTLKGCQRRATGRGSLRASWIHETAFASFPFVPSAQMNDVRVQVMSNLQKRFAGTQVVLFQLVDSTDNGVEIVPVV